MVPTSLYYRHLSKVKRAQKLSSEVPEGSPRLLSAGLDS